MNKPKSVSAILDFYEKVSAKYDVILRPYIHHELSKKLKEALNLCNSIRIKTPNHSSYLNDWVEDYQKNINQISEKADTLTRPFSLFVIGGGNTGKSSVINALVGEYVASVNELPNTWRLDIYTTNNQQDRVTFYRANHEKFSLPWEKAKTYIDEEDSKAEELHDYIQNKLNHIDKDPDLSMQERYAQKKEIQRKCNQENSLVKVVWSKKDNPFLRKFTLVDTPGVNQNLYNTTTRKNIITYYKEANGILWIIPVDKIADKTTGDKIEQLAKESPQKLHDSIVVLNKFDRANDEEEKQELLEDFDIRYGKYFDTVYRYSARTEWERIKQGNLTPDSTEGLKSVIQEKFYHKSQEIQIKDVDEYLQNLCSNMKKQIQGNISLLKLRRSEFRKHCRTWYDINNENKSVFINQIKSISNQMFNRTCSAASYRENALRDMSVSRRLDCLRQEILDLNNIYHQYSDLENEINRHMSFLYNQYKKILAEKIWDKSKCSQSFPTVKFSQSMVVDDAINILNKRMDLTTWAIGDFFRSVFDAFRLSDKIKDEYRGRFDDCSQKLSSNIERMFLAYAEDMESFLQQQFANAYIPLEDYDTVLVKLEKMEELVDALETKRPGIVEIIKQGEKNGYTGINS